MQESIIEEIEYEVILRGPIGALDRVHFLVTRLNQSGEVTLSTERLKQFIRLFQGKSRDLLNKLIQNQHSEKILVREIEELVRLHVQFSAITGRWNSENKDLQVLKISFIEDVYDCLSLSEIPQFFELLSSDVDILQRIPEIEKYTLLKISNSILKRLSRTHEVEMRGKIQVFLTKLLPICHKSGLGTRKVANERQFSFNESNDDVHQSEIPFTLYKNFWSLQKYLNQPENLINYSVALNEDELVEDGSEVHRSKLKKDPKQLEQSRISNLHTIAKIISKILLYYQQNPIGRTKYSVQRRFPKYLTKYSLFKDQLNDGVFRKIFLTQVLLFCVSQRLGKQISSKNDEERNLLAQLETDCKAVMRDFIDDDALIEELIRTEQIWLLWRERGNFEQQPSEEIQSILKNTNPPNFSEKACQKSLDKKKQLVQRIYDDLRFKQTDEYLKILKGNRCFKVETKGLEPGMNYYLNDVLFQMDKQVDESERCKNLKDYSWKAVRIISKFFLKELKTRTDATEIPDLEKLTRQIRDSVNKKIQASIPVCNIQPITIPEAYSAPQMMIQPMQVIPNNGNQTIVRRPRLEDQGQHNSRSRG